MVSLKNLATGKQVEIARAARMAPILPLAEERLGIAPEALVPFGHHKAKLALPFVESLAGSKLDGACFWLDDTKPVAGHPTETRIG